ncbi:MAG: 6-carboxytetrahydropterin synthase QueD [Spirochaetaceae bacterium]
MDMYVSKEFKFDAAHNIVEYQGKCESLHGHTYRLRVSLKGSPADDGMILDFGLLKNIVKEEVLSTLDHSYLNDIVAQSTTENMIQWIWQRLEPRLKGENYHLDEIVLWETETSFVTLRG